VTKSVTHSWITDSESPHRPVSQYTSIDVVTVETMIALAATEGRASLVYRYAEIPATNIAIRWKGSIRIRRLGMESKYDNVSAGSGRAVWTAA